MVLTLAALLAAPAWAAAPAGPAETKEQATANCEAAMGLGPGACRCFIDDWITYGGDTRALIAAVAQRNKEEEAKVRGRISARDADRAAFFVATISSKFRC